MPRLLALFLVAGLSSGMLLAQNQNHSTAADAGQTSTAQADQETKRAEIRKLIELTGAANVSADAVRQLLEPLRTAFPQVPSQFWDDFMKEVHPEDLVDLIVPIYDRYYTREDIRDLTKFYQSPVGQKTIKVLPKLSAEAISAGQEWGRGVADRAMKKLQEKGYDKTSSLSATQDSPRHGASE